jgi:hypothetical protein
MDRRRRWDRDKNKVFFAKKLSISSAITGVPGETPLQADYLTTQALLIKTI